MNINIVFQTEIQNLIVLFGNFQGIGKKVPLFCFPSPLFCPPSLIASRFCILIVPRLFSRDSDVIRVSRSLQKHNYHNLRVWERKTKCFGTTSSPGHLSFLDEDSAEKRKKPWELGCFSLSTFFLLLALLRTHLDQIWIF